MSAKQDRVKARTPTDLERKYGFRKTFSEMSGVANDNRDRIGKIEAEVESGSWKPTLINEENVVASFKVREGWYQRVGNVVTIGWTIEAELIDNTISVPLEISGVPYKPVYSAFGVGVAQNVIVQDDLSFEGWIVDSSGVITASNAIFYPYSGSVTLSGTICYTTKL